MSAFVSSQVVCRCRGAENSPEPPPPPSQLQATNSQELIYSFLQLQAELHATQLAIERSRQETREAAAQNAETLAKGLQSMQQAFSTERAQILEALQGASQAMQRSNKVMLLVVGTLAVMAFLAIWIMTYFQWRMTSSLAAVSGAWPAALELGPGSAAPSLGEGESPRDRAGSVESSNLRLLAAIEQLEKRIHVLGQHARMELMSGNGADSAGGNGSSGAPLKDNLAARGGESGGPDEHSRIAELLSQAQAMLEGENPEAALVCFDEVLALEPDHSEALVKKGATLERLHKLNEAIKCYDRAIAVDDKMTIAYLHKGGLCNRLERFKEALECYEQALRTHEKWSG